MATQVQYRRGTASENNAFTGALAEITVDTTNGTLRVHDGVTAGGSNIATVAYVTAAVGNVSGNSISSGTSNVNIGSANANVTVSVAGTSNVTVFATTGAFVTGLASVTGNVIGGNINTAGLISATGNVSGGNLNVTGNIVDTGALGINTGSNGNLTLNAGTGFIIASSAILNGQANGTGNIGNSTGYFNTVFAKATSAQYADLAEMYVSDQTYAPGTLVEFGGNKEVTISGISHNTRVAGIVSTNPSYLMNATQTGEHVIAVALLGRVPCQVVGTIAKGDRLVASDIAGVATALDPSRYEPACIIGKALESYNSIQVGSIEVAVGRT